LFKAVVQKDLFGSSLNGVKLFHLGREKKTHLRGELRDWLTKKVLPKCGVAALQAAKMKPR